MVAAAWSQAHFDEPPSVARLLVCALPDRSALHSRYLSDLPGGGLFVAGACAIAPGEQVRLQIELAKERGGHDNITGVIIQVLELRFDSDGVPGTVDADRDQTLPVDAKGWSDDEHTENLTVKEINGADDKIIPPAYADIYKRKMEAAGDKVTVRMIPHTGHVELIAPESAAWAAAVEEIEAAFRK